MGRGCARRLSGQQTTLPAGQYGPNFIWNYTECDRAYRLINIPFTGKEGLREEMPLDIRCRANRINTLLMKLLTLFLKRQTDMLNNILKPMQLVSGQNQLFMIRIGMK